MEEQALMLPYSHNTDVENTRFEVFTVVCIYIMFWDTNRLVENYVNTIHHNLLVENPAYLVGNLGTQGCLTCLVQNCYKSKCLKSKTGCWSDPRGIISFYTSLLMSDFNFNIVLFYPPINLSHGCWLLWV